MAAFEDNSRTKVANRAQSPADYHVRSFLYRIGMENLAPCGSLFQLGKRLKVAT